MNDKLFQRDKMYNSKWYEQKNSIWSEFHTQFYIWYVKQKFVFSSESGLLKPPPLKFPNPNPETKTSTEYQKPKSRVLEKGQIEQSKRNYEINPEEISYLKKISTSKCALEHANGGNFHSVCSFGCSTFFSSSILHQAACSRDDPVPMFLSFVTTNDSMYWNEMIKKN